MHLRRIDNIERLRGLAALGVVLCHAIGQFHGVTRFNTGPERLIGWAGQVGVAVFFVVSGFCIRLPMARALAADPRARLDVRRYLNHRARRILPPYWIAIGLSIAVGLVSPIPLLDGHHGLIDVGLHMAGLHTLLPGRSPASTGCSGPSAWRCSSTWPTCSWPTAPPRRSRGPCCWWWPSPPMAPPPSPSLRPAPGAAWARSSSWRCCGSGTWARSWPTSTCATPRPSPPCPRTWPGPCGWPPSEPCSASASAIRGDARASGLLAPAARRRPRRGRRPGRPAPGEAPAQPARRPRPGLLFALSAAPGGDRPGGARGQGRPLAARTLGQRRHPRRGGPRR
ncbi:MAG: acyltransferase [Caulobacteraceae bacterium]